jgi:tRNA (guanine-N7-)-methyltransferase
MGRVRKKIMRVRKKKCTPKRLLQLNDRFICPETVINSQAVFGNGNPLHIEIGAGKGRFIAELASENPEINYIAFEKNSDVAAIAAMKSEGLPNLRFINSDAAVLNALFSENSVGRIYLNFSDPWKKSRQRKRRLTHRNFLEKYKFILEKDGELHFKTDNRKLFEFSVLEITEFNMNITFATLDLHKNPPDGNIMTEYEERFVGLGVPINKLTAKFR